MGSFLVWVSFALTAFALYILLRDDVPFLHLRKITTKGAVIGHSSVIDEGDRAFSARISFTDEAGAKLEFVDMFRTPAPEPAAGAIIDIIYPQGRPDKARVPRPWLRLLLYTVIVGMNGILVAKLLGLLGD